ncbi:MULTISPECIES: hypothetical protein [unclassified Variovorax]|uniref:hypothetical protein n=1 Tax=unclassified Variovorax TaxID=663243 RepID=UPI0013189060|nr:MULTISPECIES: hypothetical protein [unclassified Variovorax]VTU42769.1 hypothetical protein H6P1_00274 [Variovorax sp. PBL-H6]VTU43695.1 hypothetical protein SRS16P1_00630 [Variovorax sp. SRS16]VTU43759.1 hypothetical protein E5P1_00624 [Variovorax sp. PBL-E5]
MKKFLFAAFAALSMIAVSAHADAVNTTSSKALVPASEAVPAASVSEKAGKFVGLAITSPFALIKSVAPTALDGIKSVAGDFKEGFVKGATSLTSSTPAVSQDNGQTQAATSTSGRSNDSVEKGVVVSESPSTPTAGPSLPPHVAKVVALLRSPSASVAHRTDYPKQ